MSENLFAYTATNSGYSEVTQVLSMVNVLRLPLLCLL